MDVSEVRGGSDVGAIAPGSWVLQCRFDDDLRVVVGPGQEYDVLTNTTTNTDLLEGKLAFVVYFDIKSEHCEDFAKAIAEEKKAIDELEPETLLFEAYRSRIDATKFVVFEIFESWDGIEKHHALPHYLKIREDLEMWQATPRSHDTGYYVLPSTSSSTL